MMLSSAIVAQVALVASSVLDESSNAVLFVSVVGTIAFTLSGVMAAADAGMDWLGGIVLGAVAAIGGGTIRDLLIDEPVAWTVDSWPLVVALVTALSAIVVLRVNPATDPRRATWYVASDAVGLGAFVVVGVSVALESGTSNFIAAFMGVVSGVGGGIIRDVFARRTPIVFVGEIYAVAGIVGALMYLTLVETNAPDLARLSIPLAVVVAVRGVAVRRSLRLPGLNR